MRASGSGEPPPDLSQVTGREPFAMLATVLLFLLAVAAWARVLVSPMQAADMAGMEMAMTPSVIDAVAYVAAWAVMMTAMMLPSALPMIDLYAATQRNAGSTPLKAIRVGLFALMYLGLWALTGVPIYFASVVLSAVGAGVLAYVVAGVLVSAGIFQLSPLKQVCLRHCRSPLGFLFGHWREGWQGGLAMGRAHALYCLGCCWRVTWRTFSGRSAANTAKPAAVIPCVRARRPGSRRGRPRVTATRGSSSASTEVSTEPPGSTA